MPSRKNTRKKTKKKGNSQIKKSFKFIQNLFRNKIKSIQKMKSKKK